MRPIAVHRSIYQSFGGTRRKGELPATARAPSTRPPPQPNTLFRAGEKKRQKTPRSALASVAAPLPPPPPPLAKANPSFPFRPRKKRRSKRRRTYRNGAWAPLLNTVRMPALTRALRCALLAARVALAREKARRAFASHGEMLSQPAAALARLPPASVRVLVGFGAALLVSLVVLHRRPAARGRRAAAAREYDPAARFLALSEGANATIAADLRALTAGRTRDGRGGRRRRAGASGSAPRARTLTREYTPLLPYLGHASSRCSAPTGPSSRTCPRRAGGRRAPPRAAVHAYAPSGGAVAEAVFVNLGREEDYLTLERLGVSVRGRVAVAIRGGGYRGGWCAAPRKGAPLPFSLPATRTAGSRGAR